MTKFALAAACSLTLAAALAAEDAPQAAATAPAEREVAIERWLVAGPVDLAAPAFLAAGEFEPLAVDPVDPTRFDPREGSPLALPGAAGSAGLAFRPGALSESSGAKGPRLALLFARVRIDRFVKAELRLRSRHPLRAWLDGAKVADKAKADAVDAEKPDTAKADLALEPGSHRLLVASAYLPSGAAEWQVEASLALKDAARDAVVDVVLEPLRSVAVDDFLDTEAISALELSPDGRFLAIAYRRPEVPADFAEHWIALVRRADGSVLFDTRALGNASSLAWLPDGSSVSWIARDGERGTVWQRGVESGSPRRVLCDVEHLEGYRWLPDGKSLVYAVGEEAKADDRGVKRMEGLPDRLPGHRNRSHLYHAVAGESGARRRLTAGAQSCGLADVRPDGAAILFTRAVEGIRERPYESAELWELDLATLAAQKLYSGRFLNAAAYAPDGKKVLLAGGPSLALAAFAVSGGSIPNDYDAELFLLDPAASGPGAVECLTKDFAPSVEQAAFSGTDGKVYLRAEDGLRVGLFQLDLATRAFRRIDVPCDSVSALSVPARAPRLAFVGNSAGAPPAAFVLETENGLVLPIARPGAERYEPVRFGKVEDWSFTSAAGDRIEGFVTYPPDFDSARSWPCIVFYYGGTSPTAREFGGRYPKDLWAAHGYVVYCLTPSGSTGRGTEFAARHVNNWGKTVAGEIIEGTTQFLEAHPFVDRKKVGCIGASYGGFMTMLLLTKTDLYAAAVAHAGISSLSSYWGEGFWGYSYSAVATADRFPWNDREMYVDQSPLFHADKIVTPLLLSHGEVDTNVPVGESEQMYTALELLGKDVEFLKFSGQNHHILTYPIRKLWMKSILAWFDWKLKGQPEWWQELYPERK